MPLHRPFNQRKTAESIELMRGIRGLIQALRVISACLVLAAIPAPVSAGPAILTTTQPDFKDPLSSIRAPTAVGVQPDAGAVVSPDGNTAAPGADAEAPGFTIIGNPGTSGLGDSETDDLTRAVRDEILGRPGEQAGGQGGSAADSGAANTSGSAAEIVRSLVNTVPNEAASSTGPGNAGQSQGGGLIASVIDATVTDLVVTLLNPQQATEGMVTFSIAGFGDFALLHLQENDSLFIVDLNGGKAIKFAQGDQTAAPTGEIRQNIANEAPRQVTGKSNALQRIIAFLEDNVLPFIQSPITLATFGLFSIIWVIWRLSSQA